MSKNKFVLKERKENRIVLEEEDEKRSFWFFFTFFSKYGSILGTVLTFVSFGVFIVGVGLSLTIIDQNSKKTYEVKTSSVVEYITGSGIELINAYPATDEEGLLFYEEEFFPSRFKAVNDSVDKDISYMIAIEDLTSKKSDGLDINYIRYKDF